MADTFVRFIKLGGGMAGKTKDLNGVRFVNGIAKVRMSDEDFAKVMRYYIRCYQAKEVDDPNGECKVDSNREVRPVPAVEGGVSESWGTSEGSSAIGEGSNDSATWEESSCST